MKIFLKIMLSILGVILLGIGGIVVAFLLEMKPDKDKEEEVRIQAEQYLEDNFNDNFEIYDTLYDNMGNFYRSS
ncbi:MULTISPECIES: alkaline shock response membrane anchor protein AmaP [unclassified Lysinibacillus]|uniref:alkaline shock response membrane anchor protein AmaP n=1 Tax=unclassified Lysinibacillus TaxID=2636778 RepID=UPI001F0CE619|nr:MULTISPECIES: alkaline shock response membrane anchor protein AmaP [unclassified Lysinibacillus]